MTPEIIAMDPGWPYSKAKTAVLSAAAAVIRESGPRAATLKNIATKAGITEPAIFRHFDGVDGLFNGLFQAYERCYQRFDEVYKVPEKGLERLRSAVLSIVDYLEASRDFAYILIQAQQVFRGYPDLRSRIATLAARDQENAVSCVAEGVKAGEIRGDLDPQSIAAFVLGGILSSVMTWIDAGFSFDVKEACYKRWFEFESMISAKPLTRDAKAKLVAARKKASGQKSAELRVDAKAAPVRARGARTAALTSGSAVSKGSAEPKAKKAKAAAPKRAAKAPAKAPAKAKAAPKKTAAKRK